MSFAEVPEAVWEALEYEIDRNDLEYADNYRAYRDSDGYLRDAFMKAWEKGCCGSFETSVKVQGEKWIVGCNYGH